MFSHLYSVRLQSQFTFHGISFVTGAQSGVKGVLIIVSHIISISGQSLIRGRRRLKLWYPPLTPSPAFVVDSLRSVIICLPFRNIWWRFDSPKGLCGSRQQDCTSLLQGATTWCFFNTHYIITRYAQSSFPRFVTSIGNHHKRKCSSCGWVLVLFTVTPRVKASLTI